MTTFTQILEKYRQISTSERDKGARFERLMQRYLQTERSQTSLFKEVVLWSEFVGKSDLGGIDLGIDLVGITHTGEYCAIQCKCYQETTTIGKKDIDTFLSTANRSFVDQNGKTARFTSCLWISTSNNWGTNARETTQNQNIPFRNIYLSQLQNANVDWQKLEDGLHGKKARNTNRELKPYQTDALNDVHNHFQKSDRGKLIMACGTGKTFTSLRIAENETGNNGVILFLVPSIALLGQTLNEWSTFATEDIKPICICSDPQISKKTTKSKQDDIDTTSITDLALPASTNPNDILEQFETHRANPAKGMIVVFSTYQSIDVIAKAQKVIGEKYPHFAEFDLIICDEAHRTTGVKLSGEDDSAFTKVHYNDIIRAKKRLYMTATPRLYNEESKTKAAQKDAILASMDDDKLYGTEAYRIGFGDAVSKGLLTDYKVIVLTLDETTISKEIQHILKNAENEITADDIGKLIGCANALSKQILGDEGVIQSTDPAPMKRAVAFCGNIADSKLIGKNFNETTNYYAKQLPEDQRNSIISVKCDHVDGTMNAPKRDQLLSWLKEDAPDNECRVLTNVRCLSEGVDVPSLDAVLFLSTRNSQVDVVQSVGRVMRKAEGKKYGYIIIPIIVPAGVEPETALDDNERFKTVWSVLNALRAHDERFNATINKIELNKTKPTQMVVGTTRDSLHNDQITQLLSDQLAFQFEKLQSVVFARMVNKCGDRLYWENWAKDVANIASRQNERIKQLIASTPAHQTTFDEFLTGLRKDINPSVSKDEAIEMLCQHIITKPVFEALFEDYSFVKNNPISVSMQKMMDILVDEELEKDTETLQKFYDSVKTRAKDIDNAEGKQRIIIELYDKFFKTAFPKMVEKLGIVYTPVEVVDFIIHSVNDVLKKEFDRSLSDENVHILDPFTGTGTFITRLIQSGLISPEDLPRKYQHELHANEIV